ncbi:MAG: CBS domain-containing protein [Casimicrobiaceae bacterium]
MRYARERTVEQSMRETTRALALVVDRAIGKRVVFARMLSSTHEPTSSRAAMIVRNYMTPRPAILRIDADAHAALRLMHECGLRHIPVLDHDDRIAGMLAERDLLRAVLETVGVVRLAAVMQHNVVSVRDDAPVTHAASVMARRGVGGLPVVDRGGRVVGVITEAEIFRAFVTVLEARTARPGDAVADGSCLPSVPSSVPAVGYLVGVGRFHRAEEGSTSGYQPAAKNPSQRSRKPKPQTPSRVPTKSGARSTGR